jgi:DNA-binding transcriptional LysR family regulator
MLELHQLRTFLAVADQLSFTRAAEALGVTQQAVSKAIRALEDELGVVLLERTTREVRLTRAGATLLDEGREVIGRVDAAVAEVRSVGGGAAGTIRIGVTPAVGFLDRAGVVDTLRAGHPELRVAIHDVRPSQLRPLLRAGELDLVLSRARGLDDPQITAIELHATPMVVCLPAAHRLAGSGAVALQELDGERLLVPSAPGTPFTDLLLGLLAAAGAHVEPVESHVTGGGVILGELTEADAFTLLPEGNALPPGVVTVAIAGGLELPLYGLRATGLRVAALERLRPDDRQQA